MSEFPQKVISGGQTGVDRAALDAAIMMGTPHGGWCPSGRLAEDGRIDDRYQLDETEVPQYHVRTERNVVDADGTLILCRGKLAGGTALTLRLAKKHDKPCSVVDLDGNYQIQTIRDWIEEHRILVLNVAGPRESTQPGIGGDAMALLTQLLASQL